MTSPFVAPDADAPRLSHIVSSPIGRLLLLGDGHALTGLWMIDAERHTDRGEAGLTRSPEAFREVEAQLEPKGVLLSIDEAARRWIAQKGYDPKMGARPMARVIQEFIKRPLAEELLFGKLVNGGHVEVTLSEDGEKLKLDTRGADQPALLSHES